MGYFGKVADYATKYRQFSAKNVGITTRTINNDSQSERKCENMRENEQIKKSEKSLLTDSGIICHNTHVARNRAKTKNKTKGTQK